MSRFSLRRALIITAPLACTITASFAMAGPAAVATPAGSKPSLVALSPGAHPSAYVTNERGSSLRPIDSATNTGLPLIKLIGAEDLWGLAIAPDGATAYVADFGAGGNLVYPVSLATRKVGTPITVGGNTGDIAITPDGRTAYVPISPDALPPFDGYLVPVNLATGTVGPRIPVGLAPFGLAIAPDGQTAYVVNAGSDSVTPVDLATGAAGTPIPVGNTPDDIAITPNGAMAYVTNSGGPSFTVHGTVTPIDLTTGKAEKPIKVYGGYPEGIAITANGSTAYVVNNFSSTVTPISLATRKAGKPIKVGAGALEIEISPAGGIAYVTDANVNRVTPINLATNKPEKPIKTGNTPVNVEFAPGWFAPSSSSARTRLAPALAVFRRRLYTAFTSASGDVNYQVRHGSAWSRAKEVRGSWGAARSGDAPALTDYHGKLYAFWTARSTGEIRYSAFSGSSWSAPATVSGPWGHAKTVAGPSATGAGSSLYVAWTTKSGSVIYSAFSGSWASRAAAAVGVTSDAPAIAAIANNPNSPSGSATVAFAWTEKAGPVGYGELTFAGFRFLGSVPKVASRTAPALGFAGTSTDGTLYLAWRHRSGNSVGYAAIFHVARASLAPADWTPAETQPRASTTVGPALATSGYVVYLAWAERAANAVEVSSALNPY